MAVSQIIGASIADGTIAAIDITDGTITSAKLAATTGSGNVVLSAAPTLTGNTSLVNLTVSGTQTNSTLTSGRVRYSTTGGVLTDSSNLQFDGSNLGVGVTPSAWHSSFKAVQTGLGAAVYGRTATQDQAGLSVNYYYDGANLVYIGNGYANRYEQESGSHKWFNAPSGTTGNQITFTQAMTLDASGYLGIGTTSPSSYGGLAVRKAATVSSVPVSASFSDSANSTFDIRHSENIVNLSAQGSGITINTGNSTRMTITDAGNVGINCTSSYKFEVQNTGSSGATMHIQGQGLAAAFDNAGGNVTEIDLWNNGTQKSAWYYDNSTAMAFLYATTGAGIGFSTNATERMRITSAGNLGVGVTSPDARIDAQVSSGAGYRAYKSTTGGFNALNFYTSNENVIGTIGVTSTNDVFYLGYGTTPVLTWNGSGNVGIGTSAQVAKLHVKGSGTSGQVTSSFILENSSSGTAGMDITGSAGASRWRFLYAGGPSTGTNALTESMCILTEGASAGRVGIGTSSPSGKLQIDSTNVDPSATATGITLINSTSSQATNNGGSISLGGVYTGTSITQFGYILGAKANSTDGNYAGYLSFGTRPNGDVSQERMRIDSSGNVGIGTSSPAFKTEIVGGTTTVETTLFQIRSNAGGIGTGSTIAFGNSTNASAGSGRVELAAIRTTSSGGSFVVRTGDDSGVIQERMRIDSSGNVGIGTTAPASYAKLAVYGTTTSAYGATSAVFSDNVTCSMFVTHVSGAIKLFSDNVFAFGSGSSGTERMRLDTSGNLLVGVTVTDPITSVVSGVTVTPSTTCFRVYSAVSNACAIGVSSTGSALINFYYSGATFVGGITTNGTGVTYGTASDYRLKENITPMTGALDKIAQLNPVTYTWKADGSAGQGFVAHELQAVVSDCVTGEKDAVDEDGKPKYQGVDTSFLVATLTKAIQEQQALIESMAAKLKDAGVAGF